MGSAGKGFESLIFITYQITNKQEKSQSGKFQRKKNIRKRVKPTERADADKQLISSKKNEMRWDHLV